MILSLFFSFQHVITSVMGMPPINTGGGGVYVYSGEEDEPNDAKDQNEASEEDSNMEDDDDKQDKSPKINKDKSPKINKKKK